MRIMYTLKGVFPEPRKEHKKNFIKENMKQLKTLQPQMGQSKLREPKFVVKSQAGRVHSPQSSVLGQVKSSSSSKAGKMALSKTSSSDSRKKMPVRIKKGDMAEFLKRKEVRKQPKPVEYSSDEEARSTESDGFVRHIGCQTLETNLADQLEESTKLMMLYPKKDEDVAKLKASGDSSQRSPRANMSSHDYDRPLSKLNSILERKDNRDPYLPAGYQKGVLPKYLRERKEQGVKESEGVRAGDEGGVCPPGHVMLPDSERRETLRMLRNSFGELVNELNKMPVKTDTLRMRNRKMELEKQLAKLEEGIKVFSRPKVFVKIGE